MRTLALVCLLSFFCVVSRAQVDPPPKFTKAEAHAFVLKWFQAWVGGESSVPKLLAFYAPDADYVDPNVPKGIKGTAQLREFFTKMLGGNPNWKFEIVEVYPTPKGLILNWVAKIPLKNKTLENFKGVDILELNDQGLISRHEDYFDLHPFLVP